MDLALHDRSGGLSGARLTGWITLSILAHLVVLAAGTGTAPLGAPYRPALLTVDITYPAPGEQPAVTAPEAAPVIDSRPVSPPPADPSTEVPRGNPGAGTAQRPLLFDTYFNVSELDVRAEPINEVLLRYPWVAYQRRLAGVVRFNLFINAQGGLDKVQLVEATPPGHFEEAALEAVTKLRFSPALKYGRRVKSQKTIEVVFDPNDDREASR